MTTSKKIANGGPTINVDRTELVWPGKYNDDGTRKEVPRVNLPFQVIETINESRATREAESTRLPTLFDVWKADEAETFEEGWRNKLIWGDNLLVMGSLLERFAGKVDLIYIDPPFASGADFSFIAPVGDLDLRAIKEASIIEEKAYRDTWGAGLESYLMMMSQRLRIIKELLSGNGNLFLHCDWHVGHLIRSLLDEEFGPDRFVNEIVWHYYNKFQGNVNRFASNHDVIFWYRKGDKYSFKPLKEKRPEGMIKQLRRVWDKDTGTLVNVKGPDGKVLYQETDERTMDDVWRLAMLQPADKNENVGFQTQKPKELVRRILEATTEPGDLIADFFCGSGTSAVAAEELGRRWLGCDLSRWAIHLSRKRMLEIENAKPFEILNLGKYERQYWSGVTFGEDLDGDGEIALYEYLSFILKLYGAEPLSGMSHLHGRRGKAVVHAGAVESPVTIDEISDAIDECVALKQAELHVLGWEWEMGLAGPNNDYRKGGQLQDVAKERGIKLLLLQIPREVMEQQAVDRGDISFFELAYLDVDVKRQKRKVSIELTNFVIPNTELIPDDVRNKITKWSDYIDYWAVDWDFGNDTFMQGWVAYRTRKDRKLELASDAHTFNKVGTYRVVVKVIDIFGNDTSQAYDVKVK